MKMYTPVLFLLITNAYAEPNYQDIKNLLLDGYTEYFCNNSEYLNCLKLRKDICVESIKNMVDICLPRVDTYTTPPKPACLVKNFISSSNVSAQMYSSCDYIVMRKLEELKSTHMPIKSLKLGTPEAGSRKPEAGAP